MDPENPVVLLCVEGMRLEGEGRYAEARARFARAWEVSTDDFEACMAAHYVARHQTSMEGKLSWNREALARAEAVGDERVQGFFPSLYLNLAHCYEKLGEVFEAAYWYRLAKKSAATLPEDHYGAIVRGGIENGLERLAGANKEDLETGQIE
jgi:tetratricopeptide (TPR) repeat protein